MPSTDTSDSPELGTSTTAGDAAERHRQWLPSEPSTFVSASEAPAGLTGEAHLIGDALKRWIELPMGKAARAYPTTDVLSILDGVSESAQGEQ